MSARYAIFFCPMAKSPLATFGQQALGIVATSAAVVSSTKASTQFEAFPDIERFKHYTQTPAHYGFHATLKAPFELVEEATQEAVLSLAQNFAATRHSIVLESLAPRQLSNFMALKLVHSSEAVDELAAACVKHFEPLRAPLTDADRQKRPASSLTVKQQKFMESYGYPFVFDEFRFHMTLTGKLSAGDHSDYLAWLTYWYNAIVKKAPTLDQLVVCFQPDRKTRFKKLAEFALQS